jgi:hypothetical protein
MAQNANAFCAISALVRGGIYRPSDMTPGTIPLRVSRRLSAVEYIALAIRDRGLAAVVHDRV